MGNMNETVTPAVFGKTLCWLVYVGVSFQFTVALREHTISHYDYDATLENSH